MKKAIILAMLLSIVPALSLAQSTMDHSQMQQQNSIDGQKNPELIPDKVAYRLFFLAVSQAYQPKVDLDQRFSHLRGAGLSDSDVLVASQILDNFRSQYLALIKEYNEDLGTQSGSTAARPLFKAKRDVLVSNTRDAFVFGLSAPGRDSFLKRVKSEKQGMVIDAKEAQ